MTVTSADIAASIEGTARDIAIAMQTFQKAPRGMRLRNDLIVSVDQLHERLCHLLVILVRKHKEER